MSDPYVGEIRMVSFNFAPKDWAMCNGQVLPIAQNQALFAVLGKRYGGDGTTTFALPNLMGRAPMHMGNGHALAEQGGASAHVLTSAEMPAHSHTLRASNAPANAKSPVGAYPAVAHSLPVYHTEPNTPAHSSTLGTVGSNAAHDNMQPFLVLNFIISLLGIYPTRT